MNLVKNKKLPFTKKYLLNQYKKDVNKYLDDFDWVDYIDGKTLCWLISMICKRKNIDFDSVFLYKEYNLKVKSLKLSKKEWHEQYGDWNTGMPKIIDIIYEIIENKFGTSK